MKILTCCLLLWCCTDVWGQTYTEFYIQKTATNGNFNAGSTPDDTPTFAVASGNWTNATGVWFKAGAVTAAVTNGAWASVFVDGTTTNTWFVGLVTNVDLVNNRIWISLVANAGTNPGNQVGTATIRVGGAWAGPNTNQNPSIQFPWGFMAGSLTNDVSHLACFNWKTNIYTWTNTITQANVGNVPYRISGYGSTVRDGTPAIMDGTSLNSSWVPVTVSGAYITVTDLIWNNNGAAGTALGPTASGSGQYWFRNVFTGMRSVGFVLSGYSTMENCNAYNCLLGNPASLGGFQITGIGATAINCISHNHSTANANGFANNSGKMFRCIAWSNTVSGVRIANGGNNDGLIFKNCDFGSNLVSGVDFTGSQYETARFENCNFIANGAFGINISGSGYIQGTVINCGFGSGSQTNVSGDLAAKALLSFKVQNKVTYPSNQTPWSSPAIGNFSISLPQAKSAGYGNYLYWGTNSSTVAFPDIGSAQSADTNNAGGSYTFAQ